MKFYRRHMAHRVLAAMIVVAMFVALLPGGIISPLLAQAAPRANRMYVSGEAAIKPPPDNAIMLYGSSRRMNPANPSNTSPYTQIKFLL